MSIKVVLFDADGVLINGGLASHYFEEKYGISRELTQSFYRGPFVESLVGKKDMRDMLPMYLKKWGWKGTLDQFVNEWFEAEHQLDDELMKYVTKLRKQGIRCFIATNQEKHRVKYMLEKMGFAKTFDGLFASAHLGHRKTDIQFFEKVLSKLGEVKKDEVLFWDDSPENVQVAKDFGFKAEIYTTLDDFIKKMKRIYRLQ